MQTAEQVQDEFKDLNAAFVGRKDALQAFTALFSSHHMHNGIYYYACGGQGKTFLLRKIFQEHHHRGRREVAHLIDFFDTANHNKRGLQTSIMNRMGRPEIFKPYLASLNELENERAKPDTHPSVMSGLEGRADRLFVECCQRASLERELVLIFDTFERVQNQEAGRWLLEKFLPQVKTPKIVLAGRPVPAQASMPGNIRSYELSGLTLREASEYLHRLDPPITEEDVRTIHEHTAGSPLIMSLVVKMETRTRREMMLAMAKFPEGSLIQEDPKYKCALVGSYLSDNLRNYVIWIMAFLRRRFDLPMLKFVYEHFQNWLQGESYEDLYAWLCERIFVKKYPHLDSHLLHDEVQQLLAECALTPENYIWMKMQGDLFQLIVEKYYPENLIKNAKTSVERNQYLAEQLGYWLDRDPIDSVAIYTQMRDSAPLDYDLEELLWIEVRAQLDRLPDQGKELCWKRLTWLRTQNLFAKAEQHAQDMLIRMKDDPINVQISLGFLYERRGNIEDAKNILDQTLKRIPADQYDLLARVENVRGQVAFRAGEWDDALVHYARSFMAATLGCSTVNQINININRAYLYSLQGLYKLAENQCLSAFGQIEDLKQKPGQANNSNMRQQEIYAWMNLGTVRRHTGEYELAYQAYEISRELAEEKGNQNLEALCTVLGHLGINQHLHGRALRRRAGRLKPEDLARACTLQSQSWGFVTNSLEIAQRSDWQSVIADALNRLAKIYRESYHLTHLPYSKIMQTIEVQKALGILKAQVENYPLILEEEYRHKLLSPQPFQELDLREKAARLFEVSALAAERDNDYHRALDSLIELLRTLLWLHRFDDVPLAIKRIEELKGYDFQEELYAAMIQICEAEWNLRMGELEPAFKKFSQAFINLAKETNFAFYLLDDRLRDLEWRLREDVPQTLRLEWCNRLEMDWLEAGLAIRHPEMIERTEAWRSEFLESQVNSPS